MNDIVVTSAKITETTKSPHAGQNLPSGWTDVAGIVLSRKDSQVQESLTE